MVCFGTCCNLNRIPSKQTLVLTFSLAVPQVQQLWKDIFFQQQLKHEKILVFMTEGDHGSFYKK
jgi:hypothetical protein